MAKSDNSAGEISPQQSLEFGAAGNAIGTIINSFAQRDLMETQQNINYANWQAQNDYNLPIHQLERYKQAGMSPAAAMQAIAGIESSAGSVGSVTPGHPASGFDALKHYFADQQLMLDKRLNDIEVQKKEAERDYLNSLTNRNLTLTPIEARKLEADARKATADANLTDKQREVQDYMLERSKRFEKKEFEELSARITELLSRSDLNRANAYLTREKGNTEQYVREELLTQSDVNRSQKDKLDYENRLLAFKEIVRNYYHADPDSPLWSQFLQESASNDPNAMAIWHSLIDFADNGVKSLSKVAIDNPELSEALMSLYGSRFFLDSLQSLTGSFRNVAAPIGLFRAGSVMSPSGWSIRANPTLQFSSSTGTHQFR